jgi:hypothetical protein
MLAFLAITVASDCPGNQQAAGGGLNQVKISVMIITEFIPAATSREVNQ